MAVVCGEWKGGLQSLMSAVRFHPRKRLRPASDPFPGAGLFLFPVSLCTSAPVDQVRLLIATANSVLGDPHHNNCVSVKPFIPIMMLRETFVKLFLGNSVPCHCREQLHFDRTRSSNNRQPTIEIRCDSDLDKVPRAQKINPKRFQGSWSFLSPVHDSPNSLRADSIHRRNIHLPSACAHQLAYRLVSMITHGLELALRASAPAGRRRP